MGGLGWEVLTGSGGVNMRHSHVFNMRHAQLKEEFKAIRDKMMFEVQRGGQQKATTDQFQYAVLCDVSCTFAVLCDVSCTFAVLCNHPHVVCCVIMHVHCTVGCTYASCCWLQMRNMCIKYMFDTHHLPR